MDVAFTGIAILAIVANVSIALAGLRRARFVLENSASVGVPASWLPVLSGLKLAGSCGLALGLAGVPWIGELAGVGLVLFFVGAIVTHLRARNFSLAFPFAFLVVNAGALALALVT